MRTSDVVIVGAGHGGAQAAIALRKEGFEGSIRMIGREPDPPYERPPLSKEYLAREKALDRLLIRPVEFWGDRGIELSLAREVVDVDPGARRVTLSDGEEVGYRSLIWAAGGDPRRLTCAGADLKGVHLVRTRSDVDSLVSELEGGARQVVVVGGGYIGLEAAAVLHKLGCSVALLEALPRVLARVAGTDLSEFYAREHLARGIDLRTEATVERLAGAGDRVSGVVMTDGTLIPADLVVVGIGIVPCVGPLLAAGAVGGDGVLVDEFCRTSLEHVFAIGDCASHVSAFAGAAPIRLESVQNANDMASTVAGVICGRSIPYATIPWFWSNQYDLKLQTIGVSRGHDRAVLRGEPAARSFSVVYLREGRVIALDCVNRVKDYVQGRQLVAAGAMPSPEALADEAQRLQDLV